MKKMIDIQRFAGPTEILLNSVSVGSNVYFQGRLVVSSTSNGSAANTSSVTVELYCRKINSSQGTKGQSWSGSITIDGVTSSFSKMPSSVTVQNNWVKMHTYNRPDVPHDASGTRIIYVAGSIKGPSGTNLANITSSGGGAFTLDTIPRYANITSFSISKRDETSVLINWGADAFCDYAWYSTDNGASWRDKPGDNVITGLAPNTAYNFKLRVRRQDSQLTTDSGTYTQSTYDYPKPNSVTSGTIGQDFIINIYNPLSRTYNLDIISKENNATLQSLTGLTTNGNVTVLNDATSQENMYASIPNSNSGKYYAKVTYGSSVKNSSDGTYNVVLEDVIPTFENFEFEDVSLTTTALTGDSSKIINNYSKVGVTVSNENKPIPKKDATMTSYTINSTKYDYEEPFYAEVENYNSNIIRLYATDSRGNSAVVEKAVDLIEYTPIQGGATSYERSNGGVGTQVTFNFEGSFWNNTFGSVTNELVASYKYKKTGEDTTKYVTGTSQINITTRDTGRFDFTGILAGPTSDNGFDVESSYDVIITVSDKLTEITYQYVIIEGSPAYDVFGNCIALGAMYDEELGGRVQINGIRAENIGGGGEIFPVGITVPFSGSDDNIPEHWLLCNGQAISRETYQELFDVIGTTYGSGDGSTTFNVPDYRTYTPVGYKSDDDTFNQLGKKTGSKTHTLTVAQMPSHNHNPALGIDGNLVYWGGSGGYLNLQSTGMNWTGGPDGGAVVTEYAGGGQPHNIIQPSIVQNFIIKAETGSAVPAEVLDHYSDSTKNTYSCHYINNFSPSGGGGGESLPVGTELDFDGTASQIPVGWEQVEDVPVYSTEETICGTWIDGKTIFRKVFTGTTPSNGGVNISLSIDTLVNEGGYIKYATDYQFPIPSSYGTAGDNDVRLIKINSNTIQLQCGANLYNKQYALWVEYTKN